MTVAPDPAARADLRALCHHQDPPSRTSAATSRRGRGEDVPAVADRWGSPRGTVGVGYRRAGDADHRHGDPGRGTRRGRNRGRPGRHRGTSAWLLHSGGAGAAIRSGRPRGRDGGPHATLRREREYFEREWAHGGGEQIYWPTVQKPHAA